MELGMKVLVSGLGRLEALELQALFNNASAIEGQAIPRQSQGDLGTCAVVAAVSSSAIGVLGLWLLMPRKRDRFEQELEVTHGDGTRERHVVRYSSYSADSPRDTVVTALSQLFRVTAAHVAEAIASAEKDRNQG